MSSLQIHELKTSEFIEDDLLILKNLNLEIPFYTRKDLQKKVSKSESYRQSIGLFTVVGSFIILGHLCSNDMTSGGGLWILYLTLFGGLYLFITKIFWNDSVKTVIRKLTDDQVARELQKARIFLSTTPFCIRDGNSFYENIPKYWKLIDMQEQAQSDFRHTQSRVNAYQNQLEVLLEQLEKGEEIKEETLLAMEIRLKTYAETLIELHENLQPLNLLIDELNKERKSIKAKASQDFESGVLKGDYSNGTLFNLQSNRVLTIEKNIKKSLHNVKNISSRWRKNLDDHSGSESFNSFEQSLSTEENTEENQNQISTSSSEQEENTEEIAQEKLEENKNISFAL